MTELAASYARARASNRANGPAHTLGVLALPRATRRHVRAVYGFARLVDDLVDGPFPAGEGARRQAFDEIGRRLIANLAAGRSADPDLAAVVDTATRFGIGASCFERFLGAMDMDLRGRAYERQADLADYLDGAALAPADMVLPLLRPVDLGAARRPAHDLALALHLADLLVDLREDLERGRCYLPADEVDRFAARPALESRRVTPGWVELARSLTARARAHLWGSAAGLALLPPASARYVACARAYAAARLDAAEAAGFDVFGARVEVPVRRKAALVATFARWGGPA